MHWRRLSLYGLPLVVAAGLGVWAWNIWLEQSQDIPIRAAAQQYGLEPALIKAIVWRESHFHPNARGRVGELGLMQLREAAALEWAQAERIPAFVHDSCLDPKTNTLAGTWYFRKLLKRYAQTDNPLPYALADFNAGRQNVLKWNSGAAQTNSAVFLGQIRFPRTRAYVLAVLRRYERYRPEFSAPRNSYSPVRGTSYMGVRTSSGATATP